MSRIEQARRKLRITRYVIGVTAAAGLAAFAAAARASHPATAHQTQTSSAAATATQSQDDSSSFGFFGDDSSISPSYGSTPQVQSGGS